MSTSYLNRLGEIDFSRTIERLAEGFTGREWLFTKLDNWLQQENGEQFYLLTGEPGVGKSAIAAQLTQRWADKKPETGKLAAYHFCRAGDVETVRPGRVLRSLATQLGKTLPHYGEALKQVLDQVHVRIDVNINIDRLSNSQVTGIYVENLKDLDPREEFRLLIQAPLAALSNIYATLKETPPSLKVFLIDSLDEAATTTGQENMVTLLASLYQARETLPPWVRFLLTARSDQAVLNQFLPLQSQKIEELKDDNLSDIQLYIKGRVDEEIRRERSTPESPDNTAIANLKPLQQRLDEADHTAEKLIKEVKDLSHGNFLYTKLLLNSIVSGEQSIKNLSALPKTLNDIYHRILRYRCSFRGWLKRYQPILGTLSVTQEPISQEQLSKFIQIKSEDLAKDLAVFQQFLDESKDEQGQPLYTIFHQSLREYLLDRKYNHDFWCDAKEQHDSIIQCFENESKQWQDLREIDLYGLCHLAQHLVKGDRVEDLHMLLSLEKDGKNAWFKVKDDEGDTAGFLADVELAWSQADKEFDLEHRGRSLGLQCRYALIKASINSLAEIPKELLVALVKYEHWKPTKALTYACQIPSQQKRFESLIVLSDQLLSIKSLRCQALQFALEIVQSIDDFNNLVHKLPSELLPKALEVAQLFKDESNRVSALVTLSDKLPDVIPLALEAIRWTGNDHTRSNALITLANNLPLELLPRAIEVTQLLSDSTQRANVLISLGEKLPDALPQALLVALEIENLSDRANVLIALGEKFPEVIPKALDTALAIIADGSSSSDVLSPLMSLLTPDLLPKVLEAVLAIEDAYTRAWALSVMADKLPDAIPSALEAALRIEDSDVYVQSPHYEILVTLVDTLPFELLPKALEVAQSITRSSRTSYRTWVLLTLADRFSEALPKALEAAFALPNVSDRAMALTHIASKLPDILPKALESALLIEDCQSRTNTLITLASKLPDILPKALESALLIEDCQSRTNTLITLASKLPDILPKALESALLIEDVSSRISVLITLAGKLPIALLHALESAQSFGGAYERAIALIALANVIPDKLPIALEADLEIEDQSDRFKVLIILADRLPSELLPKVLETSLSIENTSNRAELLIMLADKLHDALPQAIDAALAIEDAFDRARALTQLSDKIPDALPIALEAALKIEDAYYRADALIGLIDRLPNVLNRALETILVIKNDYHRAWALNKLAKKQPDLLPKALEVAVAIENASYRTWTLSDLSDVLPDALPKALEAALTINGDSYRAEALSALAGKLTPQLIPPALKAAQLFVRENSHDPGEHYYRAKVLSALADNLPPALLCQALESASSLDINSFHRFEILSNLAKKFPDVLPQALEIALSIDSIYDRTKALSTLIPCLVKTSDCYYIVKELLQALSHRNQSSFMSDIAILTPVIITLGCEDAVLETIQAIQDVSRWWS